MQGNACELINSNISPQQEIGLPKDFETRKPLTNSSDKLESLWSENANNWNGFRRPKQTRCPRGGCCLVLQRCVCGMLNQ